MHSKSLSHHRLGFLHALLGIDHINDIGLSVCHLVDDAAQVVLAGVGCIGVAVHALDLLRQLVIGQQAGIKSALQVNGGLVIVGLNDIFTHVGM